MKNLGLWPSFLMTRRSFLNFLCSLHNLNISELCDCHLYVVQEASAEQKGSDIADHKVQWNRSKGVQRWWSQQGRVSTHTQPSCTWLSYSLCIHPVPQGCEERMPFGVAQAETSLSPNIPHLLFNSSLFYYISAICSESVNISPMVRFQDCCRVNITIK